MKNGKFRNWAELPPELTSSILLRLSLIDILENAQKVCRSWRRLCKDPLMWSKIEMRNLNRFENYSFKAMSMSRHAVDLSQGGLIEISIEDIGNDSLLNYIADRSSNLRSLRLEMCADIEDEGFIQAIVKLPMLEELEISFSLLSAESLNVAGKSCSNLKTLKLNSAGVHDNVDDDDDVFALAIAESMPKLCHLQLIGNSLTNTGLNAILDSCSHLKHLDLRHCFNVNLVGDLEKRCWERIEDLRYPNDLTTDLPFDAILCGHSEEEEEEEVEEDNYSYESDEDEYVYDLSDDVNDQSYVDNSHYDQLEECVDSL